MSAQGVKPLRAELCYELCYPILFLDGDGMLRRTETGSPCG